MVKNPPAKARDMDSIPVQGDPTCLGAQSQCTTTTETYALEPGNRNY